MTSVFSSDALRTSPFRATATPVITKCPRLFSLFSISRASASDFGFPRGLPSKKTSVSKPRTKASRSWRDTDKALMQAFSRGKSSGFVLVGFSSSPETTTRNLTPSCFKISERRGEPLARINSVVITRLYSLVYSRAAAFFRLI